MNDILVNILSVVVTAVVLPLITFAGKKLIDYLNTKINDENAKKYLTKATEIVTSAVRSVLQTYVDTLKANGQFDAEAQKTALVKAKEMALNQMNMDVQNFIEDNYGDLDNWLTVQIEATINLIKRK